MRRVVADAATYPSLQRLLRLAAHVASASSAFASFVEGKSTGQVLVAHEAPLSPSASWDSIAAHVTLAREPLVVTDATRDSRFADLSVVVAGPRLRMIAGVPLRRADGASLGALFVTDGVARDLTASQLAALTDVAALLVAELELRRDERASGDRADSERESAAKLRALLDASPLGIFAVDEHERVTLWNPAAERILGHRAEDVLGEAAPVLPDRSDAPPLRSKRITRRVVRGGHARMRAKRQDGVEIDLELSWAKLTSEDGRGRGFVAVIADVSEEEAAQRALAASEEQVRLIVDHASDGIFVTDAGRIVAANPRAVEMLGYAHDELLGLMSVELIDPEDLSRRRPDLEAHAVGETTIKQRALRRKDGSVLRTEVAARRLPGDRWLAIVRDLSVRIESEEALRRSEANFRALIESSPDAIVVHRQERIVYVNSRFHTLFGLAESDQAIGRHVGEMIRLDAGTLSTSARDHRAHRIDGTTREVDVSSMSIDFDHAPATMVVVRDVTERRRMEAQLLVTERMASVGTLAAGVAHEINNPLSYVLTNIDFVSSALTAVSSNDDAQRTRLREVAQALAEAHKGAERVRDVVHNLKTFSRADDDRRTQIDVRVTLEQALSMAQNEIKHRARLVRSYRDVSPVEANDSRLGQVFLNLIVNAAQAIPVGAAERNTITIGTYGQGDRVVVEVKDTGPGIPAEILGRVFDPFFTTKAVGDGTGLGLSICHNIVTSLGGSIDVDSVVGVGTTFRVSLPAATSAPRTPVPSVKPPPAPRRGKILVIDDEPMIGTSIRRLLGAHHDVEAVTRAHEALDRLEAGTLYDVILCDLMMPEMSGMDFHQAIAERHPALVDRMLFLTGGTFTSRAREFVEQRPERVTQKPFRAPALRAMIDSVMSRAPKLEKQ